MVVNEAHLPAELVRLLELGARHRHPARDDVPVQPRRRHLHSARRRVGDRCRRLRDQRRQLIKPAQRQRPCVPQRTRPARPARRSVRLASVV